MTSRAPTLGRVSGRLRLAVAGAVVVTALTAASAAAAPATMQVQAPAMSRPGASPSRDTSTGSPVPGFLLERVLFKPLALPPGLEDLTLRGIAPADLNDRGQIVGTYEEPIGGAVRGYLLKGGRFTKINDRGQVVGFDTLTTLLEDPNAQRRGYLLDRGRFVRIDVPDAVDTQPTGITNPR